MGQPPAAEGEVDRFELDSPGSLSVCSPFIRKKGMTAQPGRGEATFYRELWLP